MCRLRFYAYDPNGNRIRYIHNGYPGHTLEASYDAQDRIVQQGEALYTFDADGYMIRGDFADACSYSARGELLSAIAWGDGESVGYTYDGIGRRVARSTGSGTYHYFYADLDRPFQVSAVRDPAGLFTAFYYDASGALFAFRRGTSVYYVASDHLGTPRVVADAAGTVVKTMEYDSYGFLNSDSDPSFELPIGFAGGIPDTTGLVRFGFRDYEPGSGRWVSRDPILYQSGQANLYQYVQNNPINWTDPWGLFRYTPTAGGPVNSTTASSLTCFERCAGHEVTVTAGREGGHSKGSAHETGQACDVGKNSNPWLDRDTAQSCFQDCFNQSSSFGQEEGNHYHFQTRPGRGGATGFADGLR